jgi:hypothetical protein
MRFLILNCFGQKNPSELLINLLKYFRFYLRIRRDIQISVHSAYSQYTRNFTQHIIRLRAISFRVISDYVKFYSAYSQHTHNEDEKCMTKFSVLSVYAQFLSGYYPITQNFIPCIIRIRQISFRVLSV